MTNLPKKVTDFIEQCRVDLNYHGVKLVMDYENNHVETGGIPCSGYFSDTTMTLACAVGTKNIEDWFGTFIHEFCHFKQWIEGADVWTESQKHGDSDSILDGYISGRLTKEEVPNLKEIVRSIAHVEYDCEKRAVAMMQFYSFQDIFVIEEYVKKANAYVAFYKQVYDKAVWYDPDKAPYLNTMVWCEMPGVFFDFEKYFDDYGFSYIPWHTCYEEVKKPIAGFEGTLDA